MVLAGLSCLKVVLGVAVCNTSVALGPGHVQSTCSQFVTFAAQFAAYC